MIVFWVFFDKFICGQSFRILGTTRDVFALKANQPMGKVIYSTQNVYFKKLLIFFILIIKRFCFYCSTKSQFLSIS